MNTIVLFNKDQLSFLEWKLGRLSIYSYNRMITLIHMYILLHWVIIIIMISLLLSDINLLPIAPFFSSEAAACWILQRIISFYYIVIFLSISKSRNSTFCHYWTTLIGGLIRIAEKVILFETYRYFPIYCALFCQNHLSLVKLLRKN